MTNIIKKFLNNKLVKLIFSLSIIISAVPSIIQDFETPSGHWTHYGMIIVGINYFIESLLWVLDLWKK